MNIWALGDAVADLLPLSGNQYEVCPGGAPLNVAVGAARLGCHSGFIGRVGDDPFGHLLQQTLNDYGVDIDTIERDSQHRTSTVVVSLGKEGERNFTFLVSPSADQFLSQQALPAFGADMLHFCSLALVAPVCRETLTEAIARLKPQNGLLSFDVNLRAQMWPEPQIMLETVHQFALQADILKLSEEEWYWLTQTQDFSQAVAAIATYPARLKVITYGAQGAMVLWHGKVTHFNGYAVESVDTTGAGDAFMAGLLSGIAEHGMPEDFAQLHRAMAQASACGALATTQKGALTAVPDNATVAQFIGARSLPEYEVK
ncbi:aminoimidazole riboside kinase [Kluyvera genomosp. 1]|uniref:aminoimidazole riboside kinase n=1 Tax=Kluyvera genomosp. 1 TaxID=2774053 RepID=UPI00068C0D1B|nr:aminoimidazole riboside kinase [Kluyvera genomosp. 1]